jgi:hypothetical protein
MNDPSRPGRSHRTFALAPRWRWVTTSTLVTGGGGTVVLLIQEELSFLETLGSIVAIPLLGAPVLWLVRTMFNQSDPPTDQPGPTDKGHP